MTKPQQEESITDRVDPARARALMATLGIEGPAEVGSALPPFAHHVYFWNPPGEDALGPDGHALRGGGLIPDLGLAHRMWAGGRLRFHTAFRAGVAAERITRLTGVTRKEGRTGSLAFVTLRHEVRQAGRPVLTEDQDIVYRARPALSPEHPVADETPDERRALKLTAVTLFRYSALTFNAHRIHYDADYARDEGFPAPVVHGPLMAAMLASMATGERPLGMFEFRATAPLFLGDVAWLCRTGDRFWVEGPRRRVCMTATAGR